MGSTHSPERLKALLAWFKSNDISMDKIRVSSSSSSNGLGLCIMAAKDLKLGDVVCEIPKTTVLSCKSTAIAHILEEHEIAGVLGLSLSVMFEITQGVNSPWHEYLMTMPEREDIPLFWSDTDLTELASTDLESKLAKDKILLKADWTDNIVPILEANQDLFPPTVYSYDFFLRAMSLVTSRAFQVDAYHGDSMVPLADIFNHKTAGEHVHIESDADVCLICGSNCECEHVMEAQDMDVDAESLDVEDGEAPELLDESSVIGDDDDEWDDVSSENNKYESEEEDDIGDTLQMRIIKCCSRNTEVFNTYGSHNNTTLLSRYAFTEPNNPYDITCIPWHNIITVLSSHLPPKHLKRVEWWQQVCESLADNDDVDITDGVLVPYFDYSGGRSAALEGAIRIAFAPVGLYRQLRSGGSGVEVYLGQLGNKGWIVRETREEHVHGEHCAHDHEHEDEDEGEEGEGNVNAKASEEMDEEEEIDTDDSDEEDEEMPSPTASVTSSLSRQVEAISKELAVRRLTQYPTTLEQDIAELASLGPSLSRKRFALILRIEEKKILKRVVDKSLDKSKTP
ncbi:hypothetical protein SmJEL517_g00802 [Synchytrium microbalum]|uniref:N-lysine methyltransferase SETD6 n=1 Tax=Synchytrium microbalum TaxID=1806994 RepID=A0A507CC00_9FUNG|nr:uncharacterized protein SmJEL517_g00802 [Synchytrium microbalum]TPX37021.1 hypothetical protein SmJEL517_g00802 [Synchytrium microbalum]